MLILQDKYSVTTLTIHESRQSTYNLIASIFLPKTSAYRSTEV